MVAAAPSRPAGDYAEACRRARAYMERDGEAVLPEARTALLECGGRTPLAAVLLHGLTNNPAQYCALAPLLQAQGINTFVPRMPEHGYVDRMTPNLACLTAEMLVDAAGEAVDIAAGLGERVAVLGISMGGVLAAYFGAHRRVDLAIPIAPDFALLQLPYGASRWIERVGLWLPNFFLWWDPRVKQKLVPHTAYPRFSTHALMQTLRIADDVVIPARTQAPLARRIVTIVNRADPAVNNAVARDVCQDWCERSEGRIEYLELHDLPEWHDIIEPRGPHACADRVYPRLLDVLAGGAGVAAAT